MKKILAAIIILTALSGISYADIVYTTSNGSLGIIPVRSAEDIRTPEVMYSGLRENSLVGAYVVETSQNKTSPYIMVVNRNENVEASDTALIFKASELTSPAMSTTLNGVYNTKTFAGSYNGRSLFFASQEDVSIVEFDAASPDIPLNMYMYNNILEDTTDYEPELIDMAVGTYHIMALFRATPDILELFMFDGQLDETVKDFRRGTIRNDATNIAYLKGNKFAIGAEGGVSIVNLNTIQTIVSTDYPVKSICRDTGDGLYFAEQSQNGDVDIWHYKNEDSITMVASIEGDYNCKLLKDSDYDVLAVMSGNRIYLYKMNDDIFLASYDTSSLGGTPTNITVSKAASEEESSGSNCDVSSMGVLMMSVLVFALMRRK